MKNKRALNKSRVIVENGKVNTIFSEEVLRDGHMPIEEARRLTVESIRKEWEIMRKDR